MLKFFAAAALCCSTWVLFAESAAAQDAELSSRDIIRALQTRMDMTELQNPGMVLKEALGLIHAWVADVGVLGKGVGLPIVIDRAGFKKVEPEAADLYDSPVRFPPHAKKMTVAAVLDIALGQCSVECSYVIRRGQVEIVPTKLNRPSIALKQMVLANFDKKPLEEAFHELAEQTGVSIQLDSRAVKDKQNMPVTALFRNDTSLRDALVILADTAGLKVVELPSGVYITSPTNAETLQKSLREKKAKAPAN